MSSISFIPLGGAQEVGASCYFLQLGTSNILLDCGMGYKNKLAYGPNLYPLLQHGIDSLSQLQQLYISHAHSDHVGYLPQLLSQIPQLQVYMTPITKSLTEHRLYENFRSSSSSKEDYVLGLDTQLHHIHQVSYFSTLSFPQYKVSFFPAGHIPGAMMTVFHYKGKNILYTGDYSVGEKGYLLPSNLKIDLAIVCALHAKEPSYRRDPYQLQNRIQQALAALDQGHSVYFQVREPVRSLEILEALNQALQGTTCYPIYLDQQVVEAVNIMESMHIKVLESHNYTALPLLPRQPHIILGSSPLSALAKNYTVFNSNYTLHEDYQEMESFLRKLNPRQALLVHCSQGNDQSTLEQSLLRSPDCHTQIIYPQVGEKYQF